MLSNAGVRVGHERVWIHGTVSSYFAVDDDYYQGPHQAAGDRLSKFQFEKTWHLVRDPLAIVSSISFGMQETWWDWQRRHTRIDQKKIGSLLAAGQFVSKWTRLCEKMNPEVTYRIEDWQKDWPEIAERLGIAVEPLPDFSKANAIVPKPLLSWDEIKSEDASVYDDLKEIAARYGYE